MCGPGTLHANQSAQDQMVDKHIRAKRAAEDFAKLMERQMGWDHPSIDPNTLRLFFQAHWAKVSTLAHAIHDEAE